MTEVSSGSTAYHTPEQLLGPLPQHQPAPEGNGRVQGDYLQRRAYEGVMGGWKWEATDDQPGGRKPDTALAAPGWQWFYQYGDPHPADLRYAAGVRGYKLALIANGFGEGLVVTVPSWGDAARRRTADFQRFAELGADGVVGPTTALHLLRIWVNLWEARYGIPDHLLGRQGTLESNNHVVAEGWADPEDEGWGQIHLPYHPDITLAQAWDPTFSIKWTAGQLWSNKMNLGDWEAALAAYNVGYSTAKLWLAAGKPSSGGPVWHTPTGDVDAFTRAYQYVQLVRAQRY